MKNCDFCYWKILWFSAMILSVHAVGYVTKSPWGISDRLQNLGFSFALSTRFSLRKKNPFVVAIKQRHFLNPILKFIFFYFNLVK